MKDQEKDYCFEVITKDSNQIEIKIKLIYKITNCEKAYLNVKDYEQSMDILFGCILRQIALFYDFFTISHEIDQISQKLLVRIYLKRLKQQITSFVM